jgi:leader peptidase (prepilin peptidase) / N-methyltransferase
MFVVGLAFGSFLNVCISRIPRDRSIVAPPSFCPQCHASILWRDNIPLLSWILLRGRCRECGQPISLRYPVVELLTAVLFVGCFTVFGPTSLMLKACVFCFLMVGLIFMDAETGLLPHEFTYPGIVVGLVLAWFAPIDASGAALLLNAFGMRSTTLGRALPVLDALFGAAVGAGFFYLAWALYYLVRGRHGMGFGDIALIAMAGAFLGLKLTVLVIFVAPILATVFAFVTLAANRSPTSGSHTPEQQPPKVPAKPFLSREIPFGVFLGASSLIVLFCGTGIWGWYLEQFR